MTGWDAGDFDVADRALEAVKNGKEDVFWPLPNLSESP